jgi:ABC-2 type transport system ATP-binding protein
MTPTPLLAVEGLRKTYRGNWIWDSKVAVRDVSFETGPGEVVGLLGPNGSGKSTTFKCATGLVSATGGRIRLFGLPPRHRVARERLGFLPEDATFHDFLTGEELVALAARLCGLKASERASRVSEVLDRVGLMEARKRRIRTYSKGMAQRVGIAQAIVARPSLVILDEPMTGLDPVGRREVRDLIVQLAAEGAGVIFSTHVLQDVELACDRVVILAGGRVLKQGTLAALLDEAGPGPVEVTVSGMRPEQASALGAETLARSGGTIVVRLPGEAQADAFVAAARSSGSKVVAVSPVARRLEDVFLREVAAAAAGDGP